MFVKKDATLRLFLCLLVYFSSFFYASATLAETDCGSDYYDKNSHVRFVYDGDTLRLNNGDKVRLIGINTPELARNNKAAEAFAIEAKNALKTLFDEDKSIALAFGKDKKDRYGRLLAHGFLANGENIQARLLKQGYASAITFPPNAKFTACYLKMERIARCNKAGIWQNTAILQADSLSRKDIGFHLIQGKVLAIDVNKKGTWLKLDNKLTVGIRPDNYSLFDFNNINTLLNQVIIVRGWLNKSKYEMPFYLRARHPSSLQLLSSFTCD